MYIGEKRYLERSYYEDDIGGFYVRGTHINCNEQMFYQKLRDYDADYNLIFCDDISPALEIGIENEIFVNDLELNQNIFKYVSCTTDYKKAVEKIDAILLNGNQVVFSTMFDSLKTYAWYNEEGTYNKCWHSALILGHDKDASTYYYVDSPTTRNSYYFKPYIMNKTIGMISEMELLKSFELFCDVGYIYIDEKALKTFPNFETLLLSMIEKYYEKTYIKCKTGKIYSGEIAFDYIIKMLESNIYFRTFFTDPFECRLFWSRCVRLKNNIYQYPTALSCDFKKKLGEKIDLIASEWKRMEACITKNLIMKVSPSNRELCSHFLKIWDYTEDFFESLKNYYISYINQENY